MGKKIKRMALATATAGGSEAHRGYKKDGIKGALTGYAGRDVMPALDLLGINTEGEEGNAFNPNLSQTDKYNDFANNFGTEMGRADQGIQDSALTKGLYGKGGLNDRLGTEEQKLASQGFQLTPEDREAYGQASGDVSRLFGQQEQQASQSLARRGLASAGSGAAGATFSGLAGNKNEMLARAQTDIAQKRMTDTQNRVQQTRSMMMGMGAQGSQMANQRYDMKGSSLARSAGLQNDGNQLQRMAFQDKEENYKPGFGDAMKAGLMSSVSNIGAAPGNFVGSAAGAGGKAKGKGMFG